MRSNGNNKKSAARNNVPSKKSKKSDVSTTPKKKVRSSVDVSKVASPEKIYDPRRPSMMNCVGNNLCEYASLAGNGLNTAGKMTMNVLRFRNGTPSFEEATISTNQSTISMSLLD